MKHRQNSIHVLLKPLFRPDPHLGPRTHAPTLRALPAVITLALALTALAPTALAQLPPVPKREGADERAVPRLVVPQPVRDIGKVNEGDTKSVTWRIENRGSADLVIENTKPSCGCTVVNLSEDDRTIPPGGTLDLTASFDSTHRAGSVRKNVAVFTNDPLSPVTKLEFTAEVEAVYTVNVQTVLNLRALRRGEAAGPTIDFAPARKGADLELLEVGIASDSSLTYTVEDFASGPGRGHRIRFTAAEDASLGPISARLDVKLRVAGEEKTRAFRIRGEILGSIAYSPTMLKEIGNESPRGKQFAPVTLRSTDGEPFDVVSVEAGPVLSVSVEPAGESTGRKQYTITVGVREDAPPGPFGAALEVRSNAVDQPLIRIPVFGIVAAPVAVDPPLILFRRDGSPKGLVRRVRVESFPPRPLEILEASCTHAAVEARVVERDPSDEDEHIRYVDVALHGALSPEARDAALTLRTNVAGAELVKIPIEVIGR